MPKQEETIHTEVFTQMTIDENQESSILAIFEGGWFESLGGYTIISHQRQ